jgi:perosamine synthetase
MEVLANNGIDSRPFFHPLSATPAYAGTPSAERAMRENTVSHSIHNRALNLPSALMLTEDHVDRVCAAVRAMIK